MLTFGRILAIGRTNMENHLSFDIYNSNNYLFVFTKFTLIPEVILPTQLVVAAVVNWLTCCCAHYNPIWLTFEPAVCEECRLDFHLNRFTAEETNHESCYEAAEKGRRLNRG